MASTDTQNLHHLKARWRPTLNSRLALEEKGSCGNFNVDDDNTDKISQIDYIITTSLVQITIIHHTFWLQVLEQFVDS
jgi:hypothetical protein